MSHTQALDRNKHRLPLHRSTSASERSHSIHHSLYHCEVHATWCTPSRHHAHCHHGCAAAPTLTFEAPQQSPSQGCGAAPTLMERLSPSFSGRLSSKRMEPLMPPERQANERMDGWMRKLRVEK